MNRIFWGGFNTVETSALGMLLHDPNYKNDCKDGCKDDEVMINDLEQLKSLASQAVLIEPRIEPRLDKSINPFIDQISEQKNSLYAKQTTQKIQAAWKMSSFSAIIHSSSDPAPFLNPEKTDQANLDINKKETLITLSDFPKGAGSGDFFHSIFETLDFTSDAEEIDSQVKAKFNQFGFSDPGMLNSATKSVKEVLETNLVTSSRQFCLKDIKPDQRFSEMEFIFPVNAFNIKSIIKTFEQSDSKPETSNYLKKLSMLTTSSLKGFIKGFIDLVIQYKGKWYIVDYKSNFLGAAYENYSQEAILHTMSEHHYFLQYYIYSVALHRYLELRVKDYDYHTHFGGVFYLFIRGMHAEFGSQYGVYHDRPEKSAIIELSDFQGQ